MADVKNVMSVDAGDIKNIMGVSTDNIKSVMSLDFPAGIPAWAGTRAIIMGGTTYTSAGANRSINDVQYKTLATDGDTTDFDDLANAAHHARGSGSNGTKVVKGGGMRHHASGTVWSEDFIESLTVATTGSVVDAGDLDIGSYNAGSSGASNGTYCFFAGGGFAGIGTGAHIEYMNISSGWGGTDAGDIGTGTSYGHCTTNGDSKFLIMGISSSSNTAIDTHSFSTYANSSAYGSVATIAIAYSGVVCAVDRVVTAGGYVWPNYLTRMQFFPVATNADGDSSDEADLIYGMSTMGTTSDGTRGEFYGGMNDDLALQLQDNSIQKVTIASLADATDIGDLQDHAYASGSGHTYSMAGGMHSAACQTGT